MRHGILRCGAVGTLQPRALARVRGISLRRLVYAPGTIARGRGLKPAATSHYAFRGTRGHRRALVRARRAGCARSARGRGLKPAATSHYAFRGTRDDWRALVAAGF